MKFTRIDYLNKKCNHREFYSQFVNKLHISIVKRRIGLKRLINSNDDSLNDIPLSEWDNLGVFSGKSMAESVCIWKEAGKQIIENHETSI